MNAAEKLELHDVVEIAKHYRLQWEQVPQAWMLLYPEGRVQLNESAGEIFRRLDGKSSVAMIIEELERSFNEADLRAPVLDALALAQQQGWIQVRSHDG